MRESHTRGGDISDSSCNFPPVPQGQGWLPLVARTELQGQQVLQHTTALVLSPGTEASGSCRSYHIGQPVSRPGCSLFTSTVTVVMPLASGDIRECLCCGGRRKVHAQFRREKYFWVCSLRFIPVGVMGAMVKASKGRVQSSSSLTHCCCFLFRFCRQTETS